MILLNDFRRQWEDTKQEALEAFSAVGESGWYILGEQVKCFEAALARTWRMGHAVGVASGLDAIEISLKILGCGAGDKVLTTPLSAFATTLAIIKTGATPVFADTDEFGLIHLAQCRDLLRRDPKIRFLVPVHLYGHALDLNEIAQLRRDFTCSVIEDCAQSILASFQGTPVGTVGALAATSFYPTKNLGALGDGGAILTNTDEYEKLARALRDYGQSAKYRHDWIGYNSRLDELHCAILSRAYLPKLAAWTNRRREVAKSYLKGIRNPAIHLPGQPAGSESVWHLFPVRVAPDRKAAFMQYLKQEGIASGEHYPMVIPDQKALAPGSFEEPARCITARAIAASEVSLPIHPYLTGEEVQAVVDACNQWGG